MFTKYPASSSQINTNPLSNSPRVGFSKVRIFHSRWGFSAGFFCTLNVSPLLEVWKIFLSASLIHALIYGRSGCMPSHKQCENVLKYRRTLENTLGMQEMLIFLLGFGHPRRASGKESAWFWVQLLPKHQLFLGTSSKIRRCDRRPSSPPPGWRGGGQLSPPSSKLFPSGLLLECTVQHTQERGRKACLLQIFYHVVEACLLKYRVKQRSKLRTRGPSRGMLNVWVFTSSFVKARDFVEKVAKINNTFHQVIVSNMRTVWKTWKTFHPCFLAENMIYVLRMYRRLNITK